MKNLLLCDNNYVFGICVKRCNIRRVHGETESLDNDGFDLNQESALLPFSLVVIHNKWGNYYYIKSRFAYGWVDKNSVAVIEREKAKELFFSEQFCVITDPTVSLCGIDYPMSCRIPLIGGQLYIPFYENNSLVFKTCPQKEGCHSGYLPFTRNNILSQAVKFIGTPYDWGEKNGGLDCSALIMHTFACCGISLPRQSEEQAKITFPVSSYPTQDAHLAKPADIIHSPGHVMLSLGGRIVIHASATAGKVCVSGI